MYSTLSSGLNVAGQMVEWVDFFVSKPTISAYTFSHVCRRRLTVG